MHSHAEAAGPGSGKPRAAHRVLAWLADSVPAQPVIDSAEILAHIFNGELGLARCSCDSAKGSDAQVCSLAAVDHWSVALPGARQVAAYASAIGADVVVVGRQRVRPFPYLTQNRPSPWYRIASCPVLYVGPHQEGVETLRSLRELICFVPFHGATPTIVRQAAAFAKVTGARLTLAHAVPQASESLLTASLMSDGDLELDPDRALSRLRGLASACDVATDVQVYRSSYRSAFRKLDRAMVDTVLAVGQWPGRPSPNQDLIVNANLPVLSIPYNR